MTMSGYSNVIVDVMLGWLKGLANWVLRLFNLAGSVTTSPLLWLSRNWLKLLIVLLVVGVVLDRLIWLIRWRPYWVWFKKERVIVNDDKFFASADMDKAPSWESDLEENWDEHDYVVASTVVRRREEGKARGAVVKNGKRPPQKQVQQRRGRTNARVERHVDRTGKPGVHKQGDTKQPQKSARTRREADGRASTPDSIFAGKLNKPEVSDLYEDEVFNVSSLPDPSDYGSGGQRKDKSA